MKCPNCGSNVPSGCHCPVCGVDTFVFKKARNASIRLYNAALQSAKEQDLSGAATLLEQSLIFDKNHYQARNLLGLIYLETGRIADALKHWIISTSLVSENNPATSYIEYLQKNAREMEQYNDAIRLYNQALYYLHQGSDDLAIIQLKKCLDLNPNLLDGYNLMTLCCLMEHNEKRAQHFPEPVLFVPVIKALLPARDRREAAEDEHAALRRVFGRKAHDSVTHSTLFTLKNQAKYGFGQTETHL